MFSLRVLSRPLSSIAQRKCLSSPPISSFSTTCRTLSEERTVKFKTVNGEYVGKAKIGDSLLDVVVNNDLALDGYGACEGTLACCTCHVILSPEHYGRVDKINPPSEEELDLLDLAPELCDHSRLGCQIKVDPKDPLEIVVEVPEVKRDARLLD